ncbi:MAG TPA: outer membrane protein transport protein [Nitrospirales bacterium]|nr:outer membrane protein transport protein [Nitrospirales bacterium]
MKDCRSKEGLWALGVLIFLLVAFPATAGAGGLFLTEIGTADVGLAGAGWAARAQDPATLFRNPAGMSLLEGNQFLAGAQLLYADMKFSSQGSSGFLGTGNGGNPVDVFPGGSAFYTHSLGRDFKLGIGVFSNFGLGLKYTGEWIGRYYAKESTLVGASIMPAASYRVNEWLSIGAALNVMVAQLKYVTAINQIGSDGSLRLQDVTAGVGGNVGIMLEPKKGTRLGVTYYSQVDLDFGSTPSFDNLGAGTNAILTAAGLKGNEIDLGMTVPQHVVVSVFHQFTDRLALMADFGWEDWSRFGKVDVSVDESGTSLTTDIPFQDTYHVGGGGQFRLNPQWLINAGVGYDSAMLKDGDRTVGLPVGSTYKFGVGAEWRPKETYTVGFNYEFAWSGDMTVNQQAALPGPIASRGNVVGTFKDANIHFFNVNVKW